MFFLVSLLELFLLGLQPESTAISIHVVDMSDDLPSAHISVNNSAIGITDNYGNAVIPGVHIGDEISVSHIAYETECFTVKTISDTTVVLTPKCYNIPESVYSQDYDFDILKEKLRPGLDNGTLNEKIPVVSTDTIANVDRSIFIKESGYLFYYARYMEPMLTRHNAQITGSYNSDKKNLAKEDINKLKTDLIQCLSNVGAFTEYACKCKKYKGFRVEYRGVNQDKEVFYFFIPPQDNAHSNKFRGFLYIDSNTGILNHIEVTCTSNSTDYASYDLTVDYHYLEAGNSILPKDIQHIKYLLDKDGVISQTHRRHIVLNWENLEH